MHFRFDFVPSDILTTRGGAQLDFGLRKNLRAGEMLTAFLELESLYHNRSAEPLAINGAGSMIIVGIVDPFQLHLPCKAL